MFYFGGVGKNKCNKVGVGKNKCNNNEIHNYFKMKQSIDLTFCTHQALDSFSSFSKNLLIQQKHLFYRECLNGCLSKTSYCEKKTELNWNIVNSSNIANSSSGNISLKSSMWVIKLYEPFSCSTIQTELLTAKKENNLHLFHNFLHWFHKPLQLRHKLSLIQSFVLLGRCKLAGVNFLFHCLPL